MVPNSHDPVLEHIHTSYYLIAIVRMLPITAGSARAMAVVTQLLGYGQSTLVAMGWNVIFHQIAQP